MATRKGWVNTPWPQPSPETAHAILEDHDVTVKSGQYTVPYGLIDQLDETENRTLTAFGVFGPPSAPNPQGKADPDYSWFSGVTTEGAGNSFRARVYTDGKVNLDRTFDEPPDTVALWHEATGD